MSDSRRDYWVECVECAFEEAGIMATKEQIESVAGDVEVSHDNIGLCFPSPSGPSQAQLDLEKTKRELADERDKVACGQCGGRGRIITLGPHHSSDSECWKCRGEGRHAP